MKQVTVTITIGKPVNVKITPCNDVLDELLETLKRNDEEGKPMWLNAKLIDRLLLLAGLTRCELSEELGYGRKYIERICDGEYFKRG